MHDAMKEWDRSYNFFLRLEHTGKLLGIWVGERVYFSRAQLVQLLGEPKNPAPRPLLKRHNRTTGGQQQSFELEVAAAAA